MRSFARYAFSLALSLAVLTASLPLYLHAPYPSRPGPQFDESVRSRHTKAIEEYGVETVLLGDSALEQGVDMKAFNEALASPAYAIAVPGSTSAFWYLILKNIVLEADPPPLYVVILFRDTILTLPDFHVNGGYVQELDQFAAAREDLLVERAYLNFMNPLERWALAWFPLYAHRQRVTETLNGYVRNVFAFPLSCRGDCLDRAEAVVFHVDNADERLRADALADDQEFLLRPEAMDFDYWVNRSFLPEMIRLCRENSVRLILVHERALLFPSAAAEPKALQEYKRKLAAYLKAADVPLLDFSYDPRLPPAYFHDVLHLNKAGKAVFTQLLAEALKPLIQGGK